MNTAVSTTNSAIRRPFGILPDRNRDRNMVFYGRVSTEHEAQLSALENQIQWYDEQAKYHTNWTVLEKYLDRGITGTQAKKRPAFMKMLEDARQGKFDLIVTREVCRFARNTVDTLVATRELKSLGVEVYFVEDNIWTMDGDGELRLTIMATLAQEESRKVSERVKAGQKISRDNGVVYGNGNIMGYDRAGGTYVINPDQAETVRMIFDMYLHKNMGSMKIANELTRLRRKAASGNIKWTCSNVGRILANPTYMGYLVYGKSFSNNYLEQKRIVNTDKSTHLLVKGDFEPIISEDDWRKAEQIRQSRLSPYLIPSIEKQRKTHTQRQTNDLWAKKLLCSCGGRFRKNRWHKNKFKDWSYGYQCYNQLNNGTAKARREAGLDDTGYCDMQMTADWKLNMMTKMLFSQLWGERKEAVRLTCQMIHENLTVEKPSILDHSAIRAKIIQKEEQIATLIDLLMDGDISKEEYKIRRNKLEAELQTAKAMLENKNETKPIPDEEKLRWNEIEKTLNQLIDFSGESMDEDILNKFIHRITPLGNNRYAFYLNLDNGGSKTLFAGVEGRKNKAAVFMENSEGDAEAPPYIKHIFDHRWLQGMQSPKTAYSKNRMKSSFSGNLFLVIPTTDSSLSCCQACYRHPVGRTADIVHF